MSNAGADNNTAGQPNNADMSANPFQRFKRKNPEDDQRLLSELVQQNNIMLQQILKEQINITKTVEELKEANEQQAKRIVVLEEQVEFLIRGGQLNLILQGQPETENEDIKGGAQTMIKEMSGVDIAYATRIGNKKPDKARAILIKMKSIEDKNTVLQNRAKLFQYNTDHGTKLFINEDVPKSERIRMAKLREKLKEIKKTDPTAKIKGAFIVTKEDRITIDLQGKEVKRSKK